MTPVIRRFKAILADGTEIPFSTCAGSVFIDSTLLSTRDLYSTGISVYPNPCSDILLVKEIIPGNKRIVIINTLGMIVTEFETAESQLQIPVNDLPDGIFTLRMETEKRVFNRAFVVSH